MCFPGLWFLMKRVFQPQRGDLFVESRFPTSQKPYLQPQRGDLFVENPVPHIIKTLPSAPAGSPVCRIIDPVQNIFSLTHRQFHHDEVSREAPICCLRRSLQIYPGIFTLPPGQSPFPASRSAAESLMAGYNARGKPVIGNGGCGWGSWHQNPFCHQ